LFHRRTVSAIACCALTASARRISRFRWKSSWRSPSATSGTTSHAPATRWM
jgi:hypothetical protein